MPFLVLAGAALLLPLAWLVLLPLSLVQRYRMGTTTRKARRWVATLNALGFGLSIVLFLGGALVANAWSTGVLRASLLGLGAGALAGAAALVASRWEHRDGALHLSPNKWFVLALLALVAARLGFGTWRTWEAWGAGDAAAARHLGAMALATSGVVLGYGFAFWVGVRGRIARHARVHRPRR